MRFSAGNYVFPAHDHQAVDTRYPVEPLRNLRRDGCGSPGLRTPARRYTGNVVGPMVSLRSAETIDPTGTPLADFFNGIPARRRDGHHRQQERRRVYLTGAGFVFWVPGT